MRIAFDGTTLTPRRTGVGYYTEHLLHHLAREVEVTGDELVVVSNQPIDTTHPLPRHVTVHSRRRFPLRIVWMQLLAGRVLDDVRADVAHFTNGMIPLGTGAARVVTIHDMSLKLYPECHPMRRRVINRPLIGVAANVADAVVAVSNSARDDLLRFHHIPAERISVVHEAAGPEFRPIHDRVSRARIRMRYGLPERFVLYVGAIEPRKNLVRLVAAFADARRQGIAHELVCVGPYGWSSRDLYDHVDRLGLRRVVHFTGYVPADDLPVIYNLSELFVFPSIYEGFGLPVIEAMACGTPVITSSTSSLLEIAADAAETIDPHDVDALTGALVKLATSVDRRRELSARGIARAQQFSWTRTAKEMLALYRRVAGLPVARPVGTADARAVS
ncbi:MAG TPA: glycosyltransferase family 1 protein [Vicinamibacterales bacterium]|nr:glycosyltransferase family 1 protein [Vicinamibacterales bacterium]